VGLGVTAVMSRSMLQNEMRPSVLAVSSGKSWFRLELEMELWELRWITCVRQQVVWRPSWRSCHCGVRGELE